MRGFFSVSRIIVVSFLLLSVSGCQESAEEAQVLEGVAAKQRDVAVATAGKNGKSTGVRTEVLSDAIRPVYGDVLRTSVREAFVARTPEEPDRVERVLESYRKRSRPLRDDRGGFVRDERGAIKTIEEVTGFKLTLDLTDQVLRFHVPEDKTDSDRAGVAEASLAPSFEALDLWPEDFVAASALAYKAKQFDDGLYAAVEIAAERGLGDFSARRELWARFASALPGTDETGAVIVASAQLRGVDMDPTEPMRNAVKESTQDFLSHPERSKPLGFYTWSEPLVRIFQGDRILQTPLPAREAKGLSHLLAADPELRSAYKAVLDLAERLTNPFTCPDLRKLSAGDPVLPTESFCVQPSSRSHETDLIKRLYGDRPIPDGFDLAEEMISRIDNGSLSLKPRSTSGWYDRQVWALEPLVIPDRMPEAPRLLMTETYRKELLGLFKSLLALTRETHVKQLEVPLVGARWPQIPVFPELPVEPLATHYRRRAEAYRFVRQTIENAFGPAALGEMRRLTEAGPVNFSLDDELRLMEGLFHGAYLLACDAIGLVPQSAGGLGSGGNDRDVFRAWAKAIKRDPDLSTDVRMMVPVFYDLKRGKMKVWAILGVAKKKLEVTFAQRPEVVSLVDPKGQPLDPGGIEWKSSSLDLPYFVTAELYVDRVLDRNEFRVLCDEHETASAILSQLQ
jgi:hypothetical protein